MDTFVVLLRGINVGSTRKVPMTALRALCAEIGLERPETLIQSGNVIVDADTDSDGVRRRLEPELPVRFGFPVDVVVRAAGSWTAIMAANPFDGDAKTEPKMLHVYLSHGAVEPGAAKTLEARARTGERLRIAADALWIDYGPSVAGRSKLTPTAIDRACGAPATGRNWNSVTKIANLLAARGAG